MLAQPAALLFLVPEELRDREPLDRFLVIAVVRANHAGKRRRHLGAQCDFPVAFVLEVEKLADDLVAGLLCEEFEGFERRAVVFPEAVPARDFAPSTENVSTNGERLRVKVAEAGQ
jgi:hypothetical protein